MLLRLPSKNKTVSKLFAAKGKREALTGKCLKLGKVSFRLSFAYGLAEFRAGEEFIEVAQCADKKMHTDKKVIKKNSKMQISKKSSLFL